MAHSLHQQLQFAFLLVAFQIALEYISSNPTVLVNYYAIQEDYDEIMDSHIDIVSPFRQKGFIYYDSLIVHCQFFMLEVIEFSLVG